MRKILAILCLFSALSLACFAQGAYVAPQTALKSVNGVTVPFAGATITVCASATGGVPCSPVLVNAIFKDAALTQPLSNPFTADANGNYQFAIATGTYTVTVTGSGFSGYSYQISVGTSSGGGGSGLTNLVSGQVPIANSATTANSSKAIQGTDVKLLSSDGTTAPGATYCQDASGGATTSGCTGALSGMTATQVPIAANATTVTSSKAIQGTDANLLSSGTVGGGAGTALCIDANSGATTSGCSAGSTAFSSILPGTNTAALVEGTAGSISPSGTGQNVGTQLWMATGLLGPTSNFSNTGGAIQSGHSQNIRYALNTAAGTTLASVPTIRNGANQLGCTSGTACQLTVTAPTIPAGFASYSVYANDCGSTCATDSEILQPTCTALTTGVNCVLNSITTSGTGVPFVQTAYLQPPGVQNTECANGVIPSIFIPDTSGNYHTWAGVDLKSTNGQTSGTFEVCHRTWFTDTKQTPVAGNNSFVVIDHTAGTGTSTTNQDRALWLSNGTPVGDTSTRYAMEGIQGELDLNATGAGFGLNGSPDGEATAISAQVGDTAAANWAPSGYGANVLRATYFKNGAGSLSTAAVYSVLNGIFQNGPSGSTYIGGTQANLLNMQCTNAAGGVVANIACNGYKFTPLSAANRFGNGNVAMYIPAGAVPTAGSDFLIRNDETNYAAYLNSLTTVAGLQMNNVATLPVTASVTVTGEEAIAQAAALAAPSSVTCAGGASTYTYKFVGVGVNGGAVSSSTTNSAGTCTNPLAGGTPATVGIPTTFAQQATQAQFIRIDVYRTAGPMGTGKIGQLSCVAGPATTGYCSAFSDTGLVADGGTPPGGNTTGGIFPAGYSSLGGNKVFVTANFTTAANTSLQTITGLTFNLLPVALNYEFHCSLSYSQATGLAAVAFGIQSATHAATNIFANGQMQITAGPPSTYSSNTLATLASTTATAIVTQTPGANGVNYVATLDGTIEEPAFDDGNVINLMVSTATSGDAVTVLRGSYCYLY